ncbi:hypothetical protein J3F83DRAFT_736624, partial [Trichoderma novae-zelandiae]
MQNSEGPPCECASTLTCMDSTWRYCELLRMRLADLGIQSRPGNDERQRQSGQLVITRGHGPPLPAQRTTRARLRTVRSSRGPMTVAGGMANV